MAEKKTVLVVVTKVRKVIKGINNTNMGNDVPEKLSQKVEQLIKEGIERANDGGRRTLMGRDI